MAINKFGKQKPTGDTTFSITWSGGPRTDANEEFAIANFVTMSDSEKLSRKSFEADEERTTFRHRRRAQSTGASVSRT